MTVFLLRRVLQSVIVILLVTVITFAMLRAIPGNPAIAILGPDSFRNPAAIRAVRSAVRVQPALVQPVLAVAAPPADRQPGLLLEAEPERGLAAGTHLPKTIFLVGISTILALVLAVPIGVIQAVRRNKPVDHFFNGFSTILYAMPDFLIGILLILIFAIKIPIFPPEGPQGEGLGVLFTNFNALILPIAALTLVTLALFSRYMRSSVLDNLTEDYVRTAKAKGASERRVLIRHVLRNSLIPIVTLLGLSLPGIIAGALITESVFNYPGMGYLFYQAALNGDYPILLGITMVVTAATVAGSLLADIAYAVLDPRVRYVRR